MAAFTKLEDSPMFRKQVNSLEQLTDELKERCLNLNKGCKRFMGSLDEGYAGDLTFADALQAFGAGLDDPVSVAIGGPVMSKFTTAFRELGTYKELLRSQVEHMLSERLSQFINVDLNGVKAREKFVSVRKGTRPEVVTGLEEVLTYAQQSKEMAVNEQDKLGKRIQEFRTQEEIANVRMVSNVDTSTSGDGIHVVGLQSYKNIEALMQSTANGEVQVIKQGYLFKRPQNLRGEWKRRFFVLNSHGTLYYYGNKGNKQSAESGADQKDWIQKITGVIASLLNSPFPQQLSYGNLAADNHRPSGSGDTVSHEDNSSSEGHDDIPNLLRNIPGNDSCAECRSPDPDWASLNLGILICIECSGAHRNLGVHVSKVRSLRLDVKVWEPVIMDLFRGLGNDFANSIWEACFQKKMKGITEESNGAILFIEKPKPSDAFSIKERYIQSKYVDRLLLARDTNQITIDILEAIRTNDVRAAYHILVTANVSPNMKYDDLSKDVHHDPSVPGRMLLDPASCEITEESGKLEGCLQGCSLLHLACQYGHPVMVELLLLFGADINMQDFHGRTPLHRCVQKKNDDLTKHLLKRGARTTIKDGGGLTALERRMELGAITDEELFILFVR
ncbi:hypothetical protein EJB05_20692 [Eragrostis curvula]|uniref:Arf-GAP domain-containing protein n=1 Tax=Eragrostis curvula TaxID=38414 RepID=A0A5J9V1C4_9POAL|nr:hypothetical protein EJB05_20692 [Eragrostis curvula]